MDDDRRPGSLPNRGVKLLADRASVHMHGLSYFLLFPALQKVHSEDPSCQAVTDILYVLFDGTTFLFQGTDFILVLIFKPVISLPVYANYQCAPAVPGNPPPTG